MAGICYVGRGKKFNMIQCLGAETRHTWMENKTYTLGIIHHQNSVPKGKVEIPSVKSLGVYFLLRIRQTTASSEGLENLLDNAECQTGWQQVFVGEHQIKHSKYLGKKGWKRDVFRGQLDICLPWKTN